MNAAYRNALKAYQSTAVSTQLDDATPHQLTLMLYDGVIENIRKAQLHMARMNHSASAIADKGQAMTKAIRIIEEGLKASLDLKAGGEIALHLSNLYDYMLRRLLQASLRNDPRILEEVTNLLKDLREAWASIDPSGKQAKPQTVAQNNLANVE